MAHRQTDDYRGTTDATQTHRPSSKGEIHHTASQHKRTQKQTRGAQTAYSRHTCRHHHSSGNQAHPKAKTPKIHNFTSVRTDGLHGAGGGLITLVGDNITFTTTDIPSTINTHNIELQMVRVHINNTEHITISNIYIPPDDHRGQLMADVISNSDHMTLNTNTPARVPGTTLQRTSSADITTVSDALCGRTSWTTQHALLSDHLPIIATVNVRHDCRLRQSRRTVANCRKADWTQFADTQGPLSLRLRCPPACTLPTGFSRASY